MTLNDTEAYKRPVGRPRKIALSEGVSMLDLSDEFDPDAGDSAERSAFNPFGNYPIRLITARYYPRNSLLDSMDETALLEYCIRNEYFHKDWHIVRGIQKDSKDQHDRILSIKTDWKREQILAYIDKRETHTFPSHHLVFTNVAPKKAGLPHAISLKSWMTRRFRMIWFDLPWPMATAENPEPGKPNQCAVVDDDSVRAQLLYTRQPRTGKVIRRKDGNKASYFLLKRDQEVSLPILRKIFENGTKGSADLQRWAKEEGGLPEV